MSRVFVQKGLGAPPGPAVLPVNAGLTFPGLGQVPCPLPAGRRRPEGEDSRPSHLPLEFRLMVAKEQGRLSGHAGPRRSGGGGAYSHLGGGPASCQAERGAGGGVHGEGPHVAAEPGAPILSGERLRASVPLCARVFGYLKFSLAIYQAWYMSLFHCFSCAPRLHVFSSICCEF